MTKSSPSNRRPAPHPASKPPAPMPLFEWADRQARLAEMMLDCGHSAVFTVVIPDQLAAPENAP